MAESIENLCGKLTLLEGEKKGITITEGEVEEARAQGGRCLIGRIWTEKTVNKEAFKTVLSRVWRTVRAVIFQELSDNVWLFEFEDEFDMRRVLDGRPWSFDRQIIVLTEFDGSIPPTQMQFSHSPFWVQVHDMPLIFMSKGIGEKIGESMGQLVEVDVAGEGVGWGRCLRIRVVLDLSKPLDRGRALNLAGKSYWVTFKYEKLPSMCFDCGRIIHGGQRCPIIRSTRRNSPGEKKQWGVWLRVDDRRKRTDTSFQASGGDEGWRRSHERERDAGDGSAWNYNLNMETNGAHGNPNSGSNRSEGKGLEVSSSCHVGLKGGMEETEKEGEGDSVEQILGAEAADINGKSGGRVKGGKKERGGQIIIGDAVNMERIMLGDGKGTLEGTNVDVGTHSQPMDVNNSPSPEQAHKCLVGHNLRVWKRRARVGKEMFQHPAQDSGDITNGKRKGIHHDNGNRAGRKGKRSKGDMMVDNQEVYVAAADFQPRQSQ